MRRMVFAATVGALLALPSPALAFGGDRTDFDGECTFTDGAILYPKKRLKDKSRKLKIVIRGEGTCTGELDGKQVTNLPFKFKARGRDKFSCNPGDAIDDLPGVIELRGRSNNIAGFFSATTTGVVVNAGLEFEGRDSGSLNGNLDATPPPDAARRCMEKGLRKVPFKAQLAGQISG